MSGASDVAHRVRRFVDERVSPLEPALQRPADGVLEALRREARTAGVWALPLPTEFGGGGHGLGAYLGWAEQEGRSDHGPDATGSACLLTVRTLLRHADPGFARRWSTRMVRDGVRAGYAMTEPGVAGSDPTGLSTRAVRHDDGTWSVTGRKWFTSGAAGAELVLVVARSDESPSDGAPGGETEPGFTVLAVPTDSTGYTIERELDVLGAGGQYEIRFEGARVGADHVLGRPGDGLRLAGERLALGRTLRALRWVGQAQRATEMLAHRATARRIGNGTLAERQLVQKMLFEAELAVRGARALAGRAAEAVVREERATVEVGLAKVAAARALGTAVDGAVQVHGAEGLLDESGLPGLARVARSSRILDGADELHITTTARRLLREYGSTTTRLPT